MRCQNARFHMGMGGGGPSDCPEGGWVHGVWRYLCFQGVTPLLVILVTLICKFKISPVHLGLRMKMLTYKFTEFLTCSQYFLNDRFSGDEKFSLMYN